MIQRLLLCLLFLVADSASAEEVKVGVLVPLSGDFASYGALVKEGLEKANSSGIKLIYEDDRCLSKDTVTAYKKLTRTDGVKFILGPSCGSPQKAISPQVKKDDVLVMVTSSATRELHNLAGKNLFAAQYAIESESKFVAEQMNARGLKQTGIVYFENDFSRAHEAAFEAAFLGDVVKTIRFPSFDPVHVKNAALKLRAAKVDSVFVPDVTPMLLGFLRELRKVGLKELPVFSIYSAQMQDVLNVEGEAANGLLYSYPDVKDSDAIRYFPKLGAEMLFEAVRECGNSVSCVAEYLKKHYQFDEFNVLRSKVALRTIRDGKFTRITTEKH